MIQNISAVYCGTKSDVAKGKFCFSYFFFLTLGKDANTTEVYKFI